MNSCKPPTRAQPLGERVRTLNIFIDPQLLTAFYMGGGISFIKLQQSGLFQDIPFNYTTPDWTIWSSKFKKKIFGGAHRAPSLDPSSALSRASPSIRARPQISDALRPRFGFRPIRTPNFWSVVAPLTTNDGIGLNALNTFPGIMLGAA